jgi:hypothetical protein
VFVAHPRFPASAYRWKRPADTRDSVQQELSSSLRVDIPFVRDHRQTKKHVEVVVWLVEPGGDAGGEPFAVDVGTSVKLVLDPLGQHLESGEDFIDDRVAASVGDNLSGVLEPTDGALGFGLDSRLEVTDAGQLGNGRERPKSVMRLDRGVREGGGMGSG